jgi:hypothetical protein
MRLLESRLPSLESDSRDQADELATFGWWLGSGKFPETGAIERAMRILERIRSLGPDFVVVEAPDKSGTAAPV